LPVRAAGVAVQRVVVRAAVVDVNPVPEVPGKHARLDHVTGGPLLHFQAGTAVGNGRVAGLVQPAQVVFQLVLGRPFDQDSGPGVPGHDVPEDGVRGRPHADVHTAQSVADGPGAGGIGPDEVGGDQVARRPAVADGHAAAPVARNDAEGNVVA